MLLFDILACCACSALQAQRLAAAEALIKMQPHAGGATGAAGTAGDVDSRLKRLAADVRMLKERLGDAGAAAAAGGRPQGQVRVPAMQKGLNRTHPSISPRDAIGCGGVTENITRQAVSCSAESAPTLQSNLRRLPCLLTLLQGGWGVRGDGDHTMLAAKPLGGYRCMACDRPLGALDASPGPHLPTGNTCAACSTEDGGCNTMCFVLVYVVGPAASATVRRRMQLQCSCARQIHMVSDQKAGTHTTWLEVPLRACLAGLMPISLPNGAEMAAAAGTALGKVRHP